MFRKKETQNLKTSQNLTNFVQFFDFNILLLISTHPY